MSDDGLQSNAVLDEVRARIINVERKINMLVLREIPLDTSEPVPEWIFDGGDQLYGRYTYAQHGDDLIFLCIFKSLGIPKPSYLDIGAHHPLKISNTALLYQRGSRGVNVEANPNLIRAFQTQRPEDINLNVGVAGNSDKQSLTFYMFDNSSGLNTFDEERARELDKGGRFPIKKTITVPVTTVSKILSEHCNGIFPDILSIDVEGLELSILNSIKYDLTAPKVICAEANSKEYGNKIRAYLQSKGYFLCFRAGANMFFAQNKYRDDLW